MKTQKFNDRVFQEIPVAILGAGPAGLSTGLALEDLGINYNIFEAYITHGGNARTLRYGDFLYDTGPHRFHDKAPIATQRVSKLLGSEIHEVNAPSRIYYQGKFIDFPLRSLQALASGGCIYGLKAGSELLMSRIKNGFSFTPTDFASYANYWFGETIAQTFLIPFSEKLWGLPATQLSPDIAGHRLPGFSLKAILKDIFSNSQQSDHLEGRFLYPRLGYGQITDKIANSLTPRRIKYSCRVISLETKDNKIVRVSIQNKEETQKFTPLAVINTLPITIFTQIMNPPVPQEIFNAVAKLRFRDVLLVVLFFEQESISNSAVIYFPNPEIRFTRIHEPRNRSRAMSPPGKTSLVVEFPCSPDETFLAQDKHFLVEDLVDYLHKIGLIEPSQIIATQIHRMVNAYPIYSKDYKETLEVIQSYLQQFSNLWTIGRGGSFFYGHVHDFMKDGFLAAKFIDTYLKCEASFPSI